MNQVQSTQTQYVSTESAAEFLGISPRTLEGWRVRKSEGAPPFVKFGRAVRYSIDSLVEFAEQNVRRSTSDGSESA